MEVARLMLGIVVSVAFPASIPNLRRRPLIALLCATALALYAILPVLNGLGAALTVLVAVIASHAMNFFRCSVAGEDFAEKLRHTWKDIRNHASTLVIILFLVVAPLAVGWISFYRGKYADALTESIGSNEFAIALLGLMLAVFVGNDIAYLAVRKYISKLTAGGPDAISIVPSGLYVGWIERAVIFSFVAGGQADAAALAVAAKALFRLPEVQDEEKGSVLGEYIIVGTLASVLASIAAAIAVRLALGLSAL